MLLSGALQVPACDGEPVYFSHLVVRRDSAAITGTGGRTMTGMMFETAC